MIVLELPYPVSANNLHFVRGGRKVLSQAGRDYHEAVLAAVLAAGLPKLAPGRLSAMLEVFPPDRRRRDVANTEKLVVDSVVRAGCIEDDCLIDGFLIRRGGVVKGGAVRLTLAREDEGGAVWLTAAEAGQVLAALASVGNDELADRMAGRLLGCEAPKGGGT